MRGAGQHAAWWTGTAAAAAARAAAADSVASGQQRKQEQRQQEQLSGGSESSGSNGASGSESSGSSGRTAAAGQQRQQWQQDSSGRTAAAARAAAWPHPSVRPGSSGRLRRKRGCRAPGRCCSTGCCGSLHGRREWATAGSRRGSGSLAGLPCIAGTWPPPPLHGTPSTCTADADRMHPHCPSLHSAPPLAHLRGACPGSYQCPCCWHTPAG